ncbi:MAG TPA: HDOD domain-containing protein [Solimonas sp.]|nr:HDOD domain-containing protein [Solimonas sp.]
MPATPSAHLQATATRFEAEISKLLLHDSVLPGAAPGLLGPLAEAARNEQLSAQELATQISRDPSAAARLIRFANSPLYAGTAPVRTLQAAITRMGLTSIRRLLLCLSLHGAPKPRLAALRERLAQHWRSSIEVAALSQVYAEHHSALDPDEAFLAGLIHQIGTLPILYLADARPELVGSVEMVDQLIDLLQARVGGQILASWRFPPNLAAVPGRVFDPPQQAETSQIEIADVVTVAAGLVRERLYNDTSVRQSAAWRKLQLDRPDGLELGVDIGAQLREAELLFA